MALGMWLGALRRCGTGRGCGVVGGLMDPYDRSPYRDADAPVSVGISGLYSTVSVEFEQAQEQARREREELLGGGSGDDAHVEIVEPSPLSDGSSEKSSESRERECSLARDRIGTDEFGDWGHDNDQGSAKGGGRAALTSAREGEAYENAEEEEKSLWKPYWRLLRDNPHYRILWLANTISRTGDSLNYISCLTLLNSIDQSGLLLSLYLLTRMLPRLLFGPVVGVFVDRFDRRAFMFSCDVIRAWLMLLYLLVDGRDNVWILYVVSTLQFTCATLFEPCRSSMMPNTVPPRDIITANTFDGTMWSVTIAVASSIGGLMITQWGTNVGFIANSVTYLVAAVLVIPLLLDKTMSMDGLRTRAEARRVQCEAVQNEFTQGPAYVHVPVDFSTNSPMQWSSYSSRRIAESPDTWTLLSAEAEHHGVDVVENAGEILDRMKAQAATVGYGSIQDSEGECKVIDSSQQSDASLSSLPLLDSRNQSKRQMLVFGCKFLRLNKYVLAMILLKGSNLFIVGGVNTANIWFTENVFGEGSDSATSLGFLQTVLGVATLFGPLVARRFGKDTAKGLGVIFLFCFFVNSVSTFAEAFAPNLWVFMVITAFGAACQSTIWVFTSSVLQKITVDSYRGRTLGVDLGFSTLMQASGNLISGLLLELDVDVEWVVMIFGGVCLLLSFSWTLYFSLYSHHYARIIRIP